MQEASGSSVRPFPSRSERRYRLPSGNEPQVAAAYSGEPDEQRRRARVKLARLRAMRKAGYTFHIMCVARVESLLLSSLGG